MDLLQLEHFLAVVEERSFTRAAQRVSRTQSAVSQSIKKLEGEVGAPLLVRDVHEVSLTDAGKLLAEHARRMVGERDEAIRQIVALHDLKLGTLNIAAHESAALYLLPAPIRTYLVKFPDIRVGIYRSDLARIPRQVLDREVQIGFVEDEPAFHELTSVEVHCDQMVLIASPRHPLAGRQQVRIRDLGGEHFVLHRLCSTTEQMIMRLFASHNTRCRVAAELWSFENIKSFVQGDVGLAIVPSLTVMQELQDRTLVAIPLRELSLRRRTLMIYRDRGYLSAAARELVEIMRTFKWEEAPRCA